MYGCFPVEVEGQWLGILIFKRKNKKRKIAEFESLN